MAAHRIFATSFAKLYRLVVQKAVRKGRTRDDVDQIICSLAGRDKAGLFSPRESDGENTAASAFSALRVKCGT
jgi:hypothetical protein